MKEDANAESKVSPKEDALNVEWSVGDKLTLLDISYLSISVAFLSSALSKLILS